MHSLALLQNFLLEINALAVGDSMESNLMALLVEGLEKTVVRVYMADVESPRDWTTVWINPRLKQLLIIIIIVAGHRTVYKTNGGYDE